MPVYNSSGVRDQAVAEQASSGRTLGARGRQYLSRGGQELGAKGCRFTVLQHLACVSMQVGRLAGLDLFNGHFKGLGRNQAATPCRL